MDDWKGRYKYSTMFMTEFIPYIKKQYSISPDKNKHIIMGLSMGGFGALRFSMLFPKEFGICVSFMAGISTKDQIVQDSDADYQTYHQNLYGDTLRVSERVNKYFIMNNPLYLASIVKSDDLKNTKWYIQACDNDYHSLGNAELHCVFHRLNIPHEFRITNGGHDKNCFDNSTLDALNFIRKSL
jgi:S-formylglutathione hydrolase FrmB